MTITTPAELQAARQWLGLSRKDLADMTGDAESFIRAIEHPKAVNLPKHIVKHIESLQVLHARVVGRRLADGVGDVLVTFHSQAVFDIYALSWDRQMPTASFHLSVCGAIQSGCHQEWPRPRLVGFSPTLFAASEFGREDTMENRIAWARAWARQYRVTEAA
jgi:hypothetical protein